MTYIKDRDFKWFRRVCATENSHSRLICFPHAGGGVSAFQDWRVLEKNNISVWALSLPGRENRYSEAPLTSIDELMTHILPEASALISELPSSFFGHSMGAHVAFILASRLAENNKQIERLFLSGTHPDGRDEDELPYHLLPETELIDLLLSMGGFPEEVARHPEALRLFVPTLRADLTMIETYISNFTTINIPIVAMAGIDDLKATPGKVNHWSQFTSNSFEQHNFEGGHFFVNEKLPEVLSQIITKL